MTAIRETFEETGLLLAASESEEKLPQSQSQSQSPPSLNEAALDASRESIHTGRTLFCEFLKQHALSADVKALLPFTEWITPLGYSRCVRALLTLIHIHPPNMLTNYRNCTQPNITAASTRVSTSLSCSLIAICRLEASSHHFPLG
jgi:hypothetical protein